MSKGVRTLRTMFLRGGKLFEVIVSNGDGDMDKRVSSLSKVTMKGTLALSWMLIKD